ncbi:MAG: DUF5695 domain-containing protein [Acidobacteriaceae bacterium]
MQLNSPGDGFHTNFVIGREEHPEFAVADSRWFGDVVFRFRFGSGPWQHASTAHSRAARTMVRSASAASQSVVFRYASDPNTGDAIRGFEFQEAWALHGDALAWTLTIRSQNAAPMEIGDLGLPLLFNTIYAKDPATTYGKRVIRHSYIAGDNSFVLLTRANGDAPYLLMTPEQGTHLEYFEPTLPGNHADATDPVFRPRNAWEGLYTAYIHAAVEGGEIESQGSWRQPLTSKVLQPRGHPGDSVTYSFAFHWAQSYRDARRLLFENGMIDVHVAPGMVIPSDLAALLALHTREPIESIAPEFPGQTQIESLPPRSPDTKLYRIRFHRLGENELTITYGRGRKTILEYDSVEPLETLIRKRAEFLVAHQQVRDLLKWYDGEFSLWDMRARVLRTPDDTGGLDAYMVGGSDDPDLCKAPYIATVNAAFPDDNQIEAVEYYLRHFVWGKLQRTGDESPFPYGMYGSPGWFENRNSKVGLDSGGNGQEHLWRTFDYTHLIQLYYEMYRIAKLYPEKVHYLDAAGYLDRAYHTAMAFFQVPYSIRMGAPWAFRGWTDWAYKQGAFHEVYIPDLIRTLDAEGQTGEASQLRAEWKKKVMYFLYDAPYPYGSEMWFDTTAFESTQAIADYAAAHPPQPDHGLWTDKNTGRLYAHPHVAENDVGTFMQKEITGNIAARGWLETNYYQLGSDIRQGGSSDYLLSYMTQMGGWAILDYGLHFARGANQDDALHLGYASYLAGWALINSGEAQSDYGFWYPGAADDGAAGWGFNPAKVGATWIPGDRLQARGLWRYDGEIDSGFSGALRASAAVVVDDPVFGLFAYGGNVRRTGNTLAIECRDGLEQRLDLLNLSTPLYISLNRDGFSSRNPVMAAADGTRLEFHVQSRELPSHATNLTLAGLPPGRYLVRSGNDSAQPVDVSQDRRMVVSFALQGSSEVTVVVEKSK